VGVQTRTQNLIQGEEPGRVRQKAPEHHQTHPYERQGTPVRTYSPKPGDVTREWHVIDAEDVVLGRLAVTAATLLRGKHKPIFAPHADTGDFVIVVNAEKVALSGDKKNTKMAYRHSGYPGGLTATPIGRVLEKDARKAIEKAVPFEITQVSQNPTR